MAPILFSIGQFSLPSFGLFLALGFIFATVLVWRQARAWDLDEEKVLDLTLLSFFGGLIGARIYFIFAHLNFFLAEPIKIFLFNRYPGFSFWGGMIAGGLILIYASKRFKQNIWQIGDTAILGLIGGMVFGQLGCFFGGCSAGIESSAFFASSVVGLVGKRFPVSLIEAIILALLLFRLWPQAIKFHVFGRVLSKGLIYLGVIKLFLESYHDQKGGYFFSIPLIFLGIFVHYKISKRNIISDVRSLFLGTVKFITNPGYRKVKVASFYSGCYNGIRLTAYNSKISWRWRFRKVGKLLKKVHVKPTPKNYNQY